MIFMTNFDFDKDDEVFDEADRAHEERSQLVAQGNAIAREMKYHSARVVTVSATPIDADLLPVPVIEQDNVEAGPELPRLTDSETAKRQMNAALAAAKATFKLPPEPKEPANDNYRPVSSWPLMDQLTRKTFEQDQERRTKYIVTARYTRDLIDMARADPLGDEKDCWIQRTESGKTIFEHGQTLDRKKRTYDNGFGKNGEADAERFDGAARTARKSLPVDNGINRDDSFPLRVLAAREELAAIIAFVGPLLWPSLFAALSENATMTDIGLALGAKGTAAPPLGVRTIRLALSAAMEALSQRNEIKDEPRRVIPMPVKSRGSFLNQSKGPVLKVAA
jgi:hypothetical protein